MSEQDKASGLFPDEVIDGANVETVIAALKKCDQYKLGYVGEFGCNPGYIFRGELDFAVPLQSSIERHARKADTSITIQELVKQECGMASEFIEQRIEPKGELALVARHSDRWISSFESEVVYWLSLMQHYLHCTRLIDFTRDARFALFFALEHYFKQENPTAKRSLMIYCLPCKDPKDNSDAKNNKSPFSPLQNEEQIDMNKALGCSIGLKPFEPGSAHRVAFDDKYPGHLERHWGWDRPTYDNHRLRRQKGMFVYPYNLPPETLNGDHLDPNESWFVRNLGRTRENYFNLPGCAAKRLRIEIADKTQAVRLWERLREDEDPLTPATVYLDFEKVHMKPGHYCRTCLGKLETRP